MTKTTATNQPETSQQTQSLIAEKAVIVNLSIKTWNPFKVDKEASAFVHFEKHAKPEAGRYNKRLLGKQYFQNLNAIIREARNKYYYEITLRWGKGGDRLLPSELMAEFIVKMDEFKASFEKEITEITKLMADMKFEAQSRLGDMYNESEYISEAEFLQSNYFEYEFKEVTSDAENFVTRLSKQDRSKLSEQITSQIDAQYKKNQSEFTKDLYMRVHKATNELAERLNDFDFESQPDDNEKSGIEALNDILDNSNAKGSELLAAVLKSCPKWAGKMLVELLEKYPNKYNEKDLFRKVGYDAEKDSDNIFNLLQAKNLLVSNGKPIKFQAGERLVDGSIKKDSKGKVLKERQRDNAVLRQALVDNVKRLLKILPVLNLNNDQGLIALASEIEKKLIFDVKEIRDEKNSQARSKRQQKAKDAAKITSGIEDIIKRFTNA